MKPATGFAIILLSTTIFWGIVFWIGVPYIVDDTSLYSKKPSSLAFVVSFILVLVSSALMHYARNNMRTRRAESHDSSKRRATTFILIGTAMSFIPLARIGLPYVSPVIDTSIPKATDSEFIFWFVMLTVGSAIYELGFALWRSRLLGASADDILATDSRPPILYLRSFTKEIEKATFIGRISWWWQMHAKLPKGRYAFAVESDLSQHLERDITNKRDALKQAGAIAGEFLKTVPFAFKNRLAGSKRVDALEQHVFADLFNRVGPYISIGRPTETFRNIDFGAAKKFVADDKWQDTVIQWLSRCAAVVLEAGHSDGLSWEMRQLVERYEPIRLLIVLPHKDEDYEAFRCRVAGIFPKPLPFKKAPSRLRTFDRNWSPIKIPYVYSSLAATLRPFFEQNGFEHA